MHETVSGPELPEGSDAVEFLLRFARAGHRAGYPTAELEERLLTLAGALGVRGTQVSATPTLVELSVGSLPGQRSYTIRVRPPTVDLDRIAKLDGLVLDVLRGELSAAAALARLAEIEAHPLARPWFVRLAAYGLAGGALAPVLGGGWQEILAGFIVGLVVGALNIAAARTANAEPVVAPAAGIAASFCGAAIAKLGLDASPDIVTLAALVTLLPGMALTIGMRELATEHLQSGVANTANALVQLLGLVFGVGVGRSIALNWFGLPDQGVPHVGFSGTHVLAAFAAGLAFTVTLRAPTRAAVITCSSAMLAILANTAGKELFGAVAGVFIAALAIGIVGEVLGGRFRRSPLVFIVPGVLILVPGSAGFNSVLKLLTGETVSGIDAAFNTFVTAMAIAYGLKVSTVVLPRRLREGSTRPASRPSPP
jgi:uncharacterized membrane protein YjjP (DUF1212 family)